MYKALTYENEEYYISYYLLYSIHGIIFCTLPHKQSQQTITGYGLKLPLQVNVIHEIR